MNGYIKIWRKMTEWEWYQDGNTFRVFMHLLLLANHEDKKWKGLLIKRGQRVTSLNKLSAELGLSKQEIRTALCKLQATHEITCEATHKHTVVTIENYSNYQVDTRESNTQNNTQPNTVATLNKNDKNIRIQENNIYIVEQVVDYLNLKANTKYRSNSSKTQKCINARIHEGYTEEDFYKVIDNKCTDWLGTEWEKFLRPETLFGTKFENYLNQPVRKPSTGNPFLDMLQEQS